MVRAHRPRKTSTGGQQYPRSYYSNGFIHLSTVNSEDELRTIVCLIDYARIIKGSCLVSRFCSSHTQIKIISFLWTSRQSCTCEEKWEQRLAIYLYLDLFLWSVAEYLLLYEKYLLQYYSYLTNKANEMVIFIFYKEPLLKSGKMMATTPPYNCCELTSITTSFT